MTWALSYQSLKAISVPVISVLSLTTEIPSSIENKLVIDFNFCDFWQGYQ